MICAHTLLAVHTNYFSFCISLVKYFLSGLPNQVREVKLFNSFLASASFINISLLDMTLRFSIHLREFELPRLPRDF